MTSTLVPGYLCGLTLNSGSYCAWFSPRDEPHGYRAFVNVIRDTAIERAESASNKSVGDALRSLPEPEPLPSTPKVETVVVKPVEEEKPGCTPREMSKSDDRLGNYEVIDFVRIDDQELGYYRSKQNRRIYRTKCIRCGTIKETTWITLSQARYGKHGRCGCCKFVPDWKLPKWIEERKDSNQQAGEARVEGGG